MRGRMVVSTRPAGTATTLVRQVRTLGGEPLLLPGLSLRSSDDAAVLTELSAALGDDVLIFTSPAAVRFAAKLTPLRTEATVLAVGQGTARALRRYGVAEPLTPELRQDSEGLLEHSALNALRNHRVALVGAPGGRGVLRAELAARGAHLREVHVYSRVAPRLLRRHIEAVECLPRSAMVLLSSAEALGYLQQLLPESAFRRLCAATAVVSSERLAEAARVAGFGRIKMASSALSMDLLKAILAPSSATG
ncbi:uroporphyrinogen-III synthase [Dyella silvatica]|uniref:uroporphyrinogen-III synthase n=1 Tax=Dyella silvatica TaxID=2992128 RepID=UPI00224EF1E3|nr:uroporphyrinogen-III synthase [Dyella silvatica]